MRCERLIALIKSWYISVKEETMAPARMVTFMEKHIATCPVCLEDPQVRQEVEKITDIVFPEAKQIRAMALEAAADEDDDFADDIEKEALGGDGDIIEDDYVSDDDENDLDDGGKDE